MLACAKLLRSRSLKTVTSLPQRHCFPRSAQSASILAMEKVIFGTDLPGYEIGQKDSPGIIVVQEWWGVTDIVKAQATKLSAKGFRCLVPDLYKGKMSLEAEEAAHMMGNLDFKLAIAELTQAQEYLRSSGCPKVGVTGFCMGGALAFCAAQHSGVDAAAPFYGTPNASVCQVEQIKVPTLAQFGSQDALTGFSDLQTAEAAIAKMKAAGCPVEFHAYADAGHAFMNAAEGDDAVALLKKNGHPVPSDETLQLAWQRLEDFFKKHLSS